METTRGTVAAKRAWLLYHICLTARANRISPASQEMPMILEPWAFLMSWVVIITPGQAIYLSRFLLDNFRDDFLLKFKLTFCTDGNPNLPEPVSLPLD
jgi:hypothetical protein